MKAMNNENYRSEKVYIMKHEITKTDIQKAFDNKYIICSNTRIFSNDDENAQVSEIEATQKNDGTFAVYFRGYEKDTFDILTIDQLVDAVKEGWTLKDKSREQKEEEELAFMPKVDNLFTIENTTYTTKSGYVMNMFFVSIENADLTFANRIELENEVKVMRGWFDKKNNGFMLRGEKDAQSVIDFLNENNKF